MIENEINRSKVYGSGMSDEQKRLIFMEAYSAAPKRIIRESVDVLQKSVGEGNAKRGFHDEGNRLRAESRTQCEEELSALRNYYMVKVGLIMSEGAEALEDLRNGRPVNQNYYTHEGVEVQKLPIGYKGADMWTQLDRAASWELGTITPKPEGVPSEIADIVIRCLDFADEAGFSLIDAILEKLEYNETRSRLHGKTV